MANGKGHLDCVYCAHLRVQAGGIEICTFHDVRLPQRRGHDNFVCGNFEPSADYWATNERLISPPAVRFSWFHKDIHCGLLYSFPYVDPPAAVPVFDLRTGRGIDDAEDPPLGWFDG